MSPNFSVDDLDSLRTKIDSKASNLFKEKKEKAPLKVSRVFRGKVGEDKDTPCFVRDQNVWDKFQIKALKNDFNDSTQIFSIRQARSWTTLDISKEVLESFMDAYDVFAPFWKFLFTFGRKITENEFEFPGFKGRKTHSAGGHGIYESAYMLRRVEINGRGGLEGQKAWSIRQTAVYHRLQSPTEQQKRPTSTFLLISPSANAQVQLAEVLERSIQEEFYVSPWNVQRLLVADSLKGWPDYMASLEKQLKTQTDRIVLADVGPEKENLSPLNFNINFGDRQALKILEDAIIDLGIILPSMLNTTRKIREQFLNSNRRDRAVEDEGYFLEQVMEEFDEYIEEAEMLVQRAKSLKDTAKSTARLLSDILSYEEAVALKELTKESQAESTSMRQLAEKSTKDAAAVKILTVITLIYLPTTIVANFFSTQFVQTNDSGHMKLTGNAWLLAAIAIPLTIFTVMLWWTWVHFFTHVTPVPPSPQPSITRHGRQDSFRSFLSLKKKKRQPPPDVETGLSSPRTPPFSPASFLDSATGTWSTTATTLKSG